MESLCYNISIIYPMGDNVSKAFNIEDVRQYVEGFNYKFLSDIYTNANAKYKFMCSEGHVYTGKYSHFRSGHRCPHCANVEAQQHRKNDIEKVSSLFKKAGFELLDKEYVNARTRMRYRCSCGNIAYVSYNQLSRRIARNNRVGCPACRKSNISKSNSGKPGLKGSDNPMWNPDRTHEQRVKERKTLKDTQWRNDVLKRDDFTCGFCGKRGGDKVAHHLNSYDKHKKDRYNIDNGITLCDTCHKEFHSTYGYGNNTKEQFDEFINSRHLLR